MAKIKSIKNFFRPDSRKALVFVILIIAISLLTYFSTSCHPEFNSFAFVYLMTLAYSLISKGFFPGMLGVSSIFFVYFLSCLIVVFFDVARKKTKGNLQSAASGGEQTDNERQQTDDAENN